MTITKKIFIILIAFMANKVTAQNSIEDAIQEIFDKYEYEATGTIFPSDGEPITGQLQFSFVNSAFVFHKAENENGEIEKAKYKPTEVNGFFLDTLGGMKFDVVKTPALGGNGSFYHNITPNAEENQKVKLYRAFITKGLLTSVGGGDVNGDWEFALLFPDKNKVIPVNDMRLSPLHKKLPKKYIKDCPELAEKVSNKEEGYYLETNPFKLSKMINQAKNNDGETDLNVIRANVYKKIIGEYNSCK